MDASGDAAEKVARLSLEGIEVVGKISIEGAKNIVALIYTIMKDQKQTKGKTRLDNMLKTGKELRIFSVKKEDLKDFSREAKRYGVLYCALVDKHNKNIDGIVDVMVRAEDAPKINRIVERFKFVTVDAENIKNEINKLKENEENKMNAKSEEDKLIDEIMGKTELNEETNPNLAKMEKSPPSEHLLDNKEEFEGVTKSSKRKSVKEQLKEIKAEMKVESNLNKSKENIVDVKKRSGDIRNNKVKRQNIKRRSK